MNKEEVLDFIDNIETPIVFTEELKREILDSVNEIEEYIKK